MTTPSFEISVDKADITALDWLATASALPKMRLKDAMSKGAVWLISKGQPEKRLRRVRHTPKVGDVLRLYYDADLLAREPQLPVLLADFKKYSLWYKPAGLLSQGTAYADHCSLLRQAEVQTGRECWLIHRLDREAQGLVLLAHHSKLAAQLSQQFQQRDVDKRYLVKVAGVVDNTDWHTLDHPLDGKAALSRFRSLGLEQDHSLLEVSIETGRKHQIRRHLAAFGHPVLGDPRYGRDNSWPAGMQLIAARLSWQCPLAQKRRIWDLTQHMPEIMADWPAEALKQLRRNNE
ncbi:RluA family pseudouridine synthase [Pokkaliibacter sp. MBI-7]|uniref:RluA family pseudouridine synthase n=1 Tax=Pokkaliibacter sp. MBI-7 TaxID=3040600 RepID=UPI00244C933E|nr:RluA family pseudouridine synthase [Pokkaliibacter sp. MBI-7]MDH2433932.1 RluA family pseudouridine synthase [Pokkaliibacter sp. MBI-7]